MKVSSIEVFYIGTGTGSSMSKFGLKVKIKSGLDSYSAKSLDDTDPGFHISIFSISRQYGTGN
jgi:hypothetical protein